MSTFLLRIYLHVDLSHRYVLVEEFSRVIISIDICTHSLWAFLILSSTGAFQLFHFSHFGRAKATCNTLQADVLGLQPHWRPGLPDELCLCWDPPRQNNEYPFSISFFFFQPLKNYETHTHTHTHTGSHRSNICLSVVSRVTICVYEFRVLIWTFHLKCHMVCASVILLCYRITCSWFCNKRFFNKTGPLFVPDTVYKERETIQFHK